MKATARHISPPDDPYKVCLVTVTGPNHVAMMIEAKKEAARFLKEPFANLTATAAGDARVVSYERFTPHLGIEPRPVSWRMSVTVKLDPEIVKARREHARGIARGEHPQALDDEE